MDKIITAVLLEVLEG